MSKAKATKQGTVPAAAAATEEEPPALKAIQAAFGPTLTFWRNRCKAQFSTAVKQVVKIPVTEFATRMPKDATCGVCQQEILGDTQVAFELFKGGEEPHTYIHAECFECTACVQPGSDTTCAAAVAFGDADVKTGARKCHVDRDNLPVCDKHIDDHALDFPSFDPETQEAEARLFLRSWGFVKMRTKMTPAECEQSNVWISKLIGCTSGWDDATTERNLQESNWDVGTRYSGHDRGEFGVICKAKPIEGESDEINRLRKNSYRAEPITQAAEIWEIRSKVTDSFKPFFDGVDYLHSMPPLLALARETQTTKANNALRCFVPEKRVKKVRGEEEGAKGRATALKMINGVFPWVDTSADTCHVKVMVCPEEWQGKKNGVKAVHTFAEHWSECVPREPNFGIFAKDFTLAGMTLPVGTKRGEVILFSDNRPFSLCAGHENFFGTLVGAYTLTSKEVTSRVRAQLAITGVVFVKEFNRCGFRYPAKVNGLFPDSVPANFAGLLTPITDETVGKYAREIFGTNKVKPMSWPAEYRPKDSEFAENKDEELELLPPMPEKGKEEEEEEQLELLDDVPDKGKAAKLKAEAAAEKAKREKAIAAAKKKPKVRNAHLSPSVFLKMSLPKVIAPVAKPLHVAEAELEKETKTKAKAKVTTKKAAAAATPAKKKKEEEEPVVDYGTPLVDAEAVEETEVPLIIRARQSFFETLQPQAFECMFTNAKNTSGHTLRLHPERPDLMTEVTLGRDGCETKLAFFDFFESLRISGDQEDELRNFISELTGVDRKDVRIPKAVSKEGRVLRVYGAPLKSGNQTIEAVKPEDTPEVLMQLLEAANAFNQREGVEPFNQIIAYGMNRKSDTINNSKARKDVVAGSECMMVAIGGSNRVIRFRTMEKSSVDEATGKKKVKKGDMVADVIGFSGVGIHGDSLFFDAAGGLTYEVPKLTGPPSTEPDTAPVVLLVFCACAPPQPASTKKRAASAPKKKAAAAAKKAKKKPLPPVEPRGKLLDEVTDELKKLKAAHLATITSDTKIRELFAKQVIPAISGAKNNNANGLKELHHVYGELYLALTGEEWDNGVEAERARIAAAAQVEEEEAEEPPQEEEEQEEEEQQPKPKKKAMEQADAPPTQGFDVLPAKTRKTVVTADGKLAKRGTRERKAAGPSKRDLADAVSIDLLRKNFDLAEARRKKLAKKKQMRFVPRLFKTWLADQQRSAKYIAGKTEFADEDDEVDGDEEEEDDEDVIMDDDDSSNSDEEEEEAASGDEELAVKFESLVHQLEAIFEPHADVLDGVSADKKLNRIYLAASNAQKRCEQDLDEDSLLAFETKLALLSSALEGAGKKRDREQQQEPIVVEDMEEVVELPEEEEEQQEQPKKKATVAAAEDDTPVYEGWNPTASVETSASFVKALVDVVASFLEIGERIPDFESEDKKVVKRMDEITAAMGRFANYRLGPVRFSNEAMNAFISEYAPVIASRISAVLNSNLEEEDQVDEVMAEEPVPAASKTITEYFGPRTLPTVQVAVEDEEEEEQQQLMDMSDGVGEKAHAADSFSSDTGGSALEEEEVEDDVDEGSEANAVKDKGVVAKRAREEIVAEEKPKSPKKKPAINSSLDVDVTAVVTAPAPAAAAIKQPVAAIMGNNIYKAAATEEELRQLTNADLITENDDPASLYDVRPLPPNWAAIMQSLKKKPTLEALGGMEVAKIWKK